MDPANRGRKKTRIPAAQNYTDEERRIGISRLLAEAYLNRLRKQGRLKEPGNSNDGPLKRESGYDFLR